MKRHHNKVEDTEFYTYHNSKDKDWVDYFNYTAVIILIGIMIYQILRITA